MASTKSVAEKLLLKAGARAAVLNAPAGYLETLSKDVQVSARLEGTHAFDFIQVFATHKAELLEEGPKVRAALKANGLLWVSYPKGKALATDLNRDIVAATLKDVGLQVVSQVAIDDVWSALRAKIV